VTVKDSSNQRLTKQKGRLIDTETSSCMGLLIGV
jgi:hypothetical protein